MYSSRTLPMTVGKLWPVLKSVSTVHCSVSRLFNSLYRGEECLKSTLIPRHTQTYQVYTRFLLPVKSTEISLGNTVLYARAPNNHVSWDNSEHINSLSPRVALNPIVFKCLLNMGCQTLCFELGAVHYLKKCTLLYKTVHYHIKLSFPILKPPVCRLIHIKQKSFSRALPHDLLVNGFPPHRQSLPCRQNRNSFINLVNVQEKIILIYPCIYERKA